MPIPWFRQHLRRLADCGIALAPGVTARDVKREFDLSGFVPTTTTYEAFLCVLGGELVGGRLLSRDVYHLDTECIYEEGDYVAIAERVKLLAGDALPMEDLRDSLAWDDCWLAFRLGDEELRLELSHRGDWVDWNVFHYFAALLDEREAGVQLACHELLQDCLLGCFSEEQLERVNEELTLEFRWID